MFKNDKILSYGALYEENATLKKNIMKLKSTCYWLMKETKIQHRVIDQLKLLYESKTSVSLKSTYTSKNYCDQGHYKCEILHRRFNLVKVLLGSRLTIDATKVPTNGEVYIGGYSDQKCKPNILPKMVETAAGSCVKKRNEMLQIKKLSKLVDCFQAKYGLPSPLQDKIMVASMSETFIESLKPPQSAV